MSKTGPSEDTRVAAAVAAATHLMDLGGVEGVGKGETDDGRPAVLILCSGVSDDLRARLPVDIHGVPVKLLDIGERPTAFGPEGSEQPPDAGEPDCS